MTARELLAQTRHLLLSIYPEPEAGNIASIFVEALTGLNRLDVLMGKEAVFDKVQYEQGIKRLLQHEPIQYVVGHAWFYGLQLSVNPQVLIPRSETEELVNQIVNENSQKINFQIIDIGTGSGCIAISLAKNLPGANLFALDLSEKALETATENARLHRTHIQFQQGSILNETENLFQNTLFDVLVSNPPYVFESEKAEMLPNVLKTNRTWHCLYPIATHYFSTVPVCNFAVNV